MKLLRGWLRSVRAVLTDENVDLWLLTAAAGVFTVLGIVNVVSISVLSAAILALLAVLAFAQIRSRKLVAEIAQAHQNASAVVLLPTFPAELAEARADANDVLLIGVAMARTIQGSRDELYRSLTHGARIRVLVLDPTDERIIAEAAKFRSPGRSALLAQRVRGTLDELVELQHSTGGNLEVRVTQFLPAIGVNLLRGAGKTTLTVQHSEFGPTGEPGPILHLSEADTIWFRRYEQQAERMWAAGTPWPPTLEHRLSSAIRPQFTEQFGPEFLDAMTSAHDLFITGIIRNTLLTANFGMFEERLNAGCRVRVLLMAPGAATLDIAADRYYAGRERVSAVSRIEHSLRLLESLSASTNGQLEVRLTTHPMAAGVVGVNLDGAGPDDPGALFVEYYTYQEPGEPKFVLRPGDAGFAQFRGEAERLWNAAEPVTNDGQADASSPGVTRPHS
ncbi:hypothetical protein AB0E69_37320 [Kribbella sp. NPDC026611]|uniref:hypothetical protein n=1 Tax=Kribbella sp. NPDC026611 TaxID=3154911 RepID=UPI0033D30D44